MTQCDVILTYCWNRVGYTILKSLHRKGLKVWAADTSKKNICSMSKFCTGSFTYPDPFKEEDAFIKVLKEKIEELQPKVLMPTHDESVVIMRHRDEFRHEQASDESAVAGGVRPVRLHDSAVYRVFRLTRRRAEIPCLPDAQRIRPEHRRVLSAGGTDLHGAERGTAGHHAGYRQRHHRHSGIPDHYPFAAASGKLY